MPQITARSNWTYPTYPIPPNTIPIIRFVLLLLAFKQAGFNSVCRHTCVDSNITMSCRSHTPVATRYYQEPTRNPMEWLDTPWDDTTRALYGLGSRKSLVKGAVGLCTKVIRTVYVSWTMFVYKCSHSIHYEHQTHFIDNSTRDSREIRQGAVAKQIVVVWQTWLTPWSIKRASGHCNG